MLSVTQVHIMDGAIWPYGQVIRQQDRRMYGWWSQEIFFVCCVYISQEPEVVAFPSRRRLDVLHIDLQLVGDTLRAIC